MPDMDEPSAPAVRDSDWPTQATDQIVKVVGTVHDKLTGSVMVAARAVVYGLFALILGIAAFTLAIIFAVRLFDNYLPDAIFGEDHIWVAYSIVGFLLCLSAALLWKLKVPKNV